MSNRGFHAMFDFEGLIVDNPNNIANTIFQLMQDVCSKYNIRVVGKNLVVFNDVNISPPGFTSCLLLDESHCSFHLYSDIGIAAVDFFSCGDQIRGKTAAEDLKNCILNLSVCPNIVLTKEMYVNRF